MDDFEVLVVKLLAEVIVSDCKDKIKELRIKALNELIGQLRYYKELGIREDIICRIAEKKSKFIMKATTQTETEKFMKPRCPYYNGNKFVPDEYNIPEEEMICWSEASLRAPLNNAGFKRYMELFKQIFPKEYQEVFGEDAA